MKKEIIVPVLIILWGILFVVISTMVYFSKGSKSIIKKKLKAGAMILSLTGIFACGHQNVNTYDSSFLKENTDSIKSQRKLDSIQKAENQRQIDDSIAKVKEEKQKKDSLTKMKKKNPVRPVCYGPPKNTCYTQVKKN